MQEASEEKRPDVLINREYKDRVFRLIFGSEEYKENTLALYNALNGTSYTNKEEVEFVTIDNVLYMKMKNDLAFIIEDCVSIYEQQSTYNPNMPYRGLGYYHKICDGLIGKQGLDIYGKSLVPLPTPKYVVFYNGMDAPGMPAVMKMRLSDAFSGDVSGEYEWTATVYNLNHPDSKELLERCKPLSDYTILVEKIQNHRKKCSLYAAVRRAVKECIEESILSEFLRKHEAEVVDLLLTEYDEEHHERCVRAEGRKEGRAELLLEQVKKKATKGKSVTQIAEELEMSEEVILPLYQRLTKE